MMNVAYAQRACANLVARRIYAARSLYQNHTGGYLAVPMNRYLIEGQNMVTGTIITGILFGGGFTVGIVVTVLAIEIVDRITYGRRHKRD